MGSSGGMAGVGSQVWRPGWCISEDCTPISVMVDVVMAYVYSYGVYSYDLCSYGLYSYGQVWRPGWCISENCTPISVPELRQIMAKYDDDGNGTLEFDEFIAASKAIIEANFS